MINKSPICGSKNGEIRYNVFFVYGDTLYLQKVKCLGNRWDKVNESEVFRCFVLEDYIDGDNGRSISVDNAWHLQETLEDAIKLAILLIFNKDASYQKDPPWK